MSLPDLLLGAGAPVTDCERGGGRQAGPAVPAVQQAARKEQLFTNEEIISSLESP